MMLPVEIIEWEVLPRVSAKYIGRFWCICKAWNTLLSTPMFAQRHLRYQTNYKLLLLDQPSRTFHTIDCCPDDHSDSVTPHEYDVPFREDRVFTLASLDGLVCVGLMKTQQLAFWNPLTGAYNKFRTRFYDDIYNGGLAFYSDSSIDYKLLHMVSEGAFIYSQMLDSWRRIKPACLEISQHISNCRWFMATFSCGKVYFRLHDDAGRPCCLMSFDVETEKFKKIQFPTLPTHYLNKTLVALDACVYLYVAYGDILKLKCDMWRMDGDGDGWTKVATFSSPHLYPTPVMRKIHIRRNGNWLAIWKDHSSIKNVDIVDYATDLFYFISGYRYYQLQGSIYIETLVSPNP